MGESRNSQNSKENVDSGRRHKQNKGTSSTALCEQKRAGEGALRMGLPTQLRDRVYVYCIVCLFVLFSVFKAQVSSTSKKNRNKTMGVGLEFNKRCW